MARKKVDHAATFSTPILEAIAHVLRLERGDKKLRIIDPFAGTGGIHELAKHGHRTVGVELEPEWAEQHPSTEQGNATKLRFRASSFDAWCSSPVYPNRNTDHHSAKDGSRRFSYRHVLGRMPSAGSACVLPWGPSWRALHRQAFQEAFRVTRKNGLIIVNMKNHMKLGEQQLVNEWVVGFMRRNGKPLLQARPVFTKGNGGSGANADKKVDRELILVFSNIK